MFFLMLNLILVVLLSVAFVTLLERKVIGLSQLRKGPMKVGTGGSFQPFSDAIKLFFKECLMPYKSNKKIYLMAPMLSLFLMSNLWLSSFLMNSGGMLFSFLLLMFFLGLGIYVLFYMGWSSNNKYSILGSIRGIAQSVSYEISLSLMLFLKVFGGMSLMTSFLCLSSSSYMIIFSAATFLWLIIMLAESNRTPFDFSEGESELVSGFNTEFSGGLFVLIFLTEYGMIVYLASISMVLILGIYFFNFFSSLVIFNFVFLWLWIRSTLPRLRYDKLMDFAWKILLPMVLLGLNSVLTMSIFLLVY